MLCLERDVPFIFTKVTSFISVVISIYLYLWGFCSIISLFYHASQSYLHGILYNLKKNAHIFLSCKTLFPCYHSKYKFSHNFLACLTLCCSLISLPFKYHSNKPTMANFTAFPEASFTSSGQWLFI